ncbi:MAG: nucleoside diphosphate kinase regulator [Patescibacteria group bacterium]|nr:nucleoside diphosphate kinase regulator [Patescibacteria group bacterium]MDD5715456.1 nucleoside diphosphate kinase regulator [Patescibacteria group bacterium]
MNTIYITKNDHKKLIEIINNKLPIDENDKALREELNRAEIVEPQNIPGDVITMNSQVVFCDSDTNEELEYWLVFPNDADISQKKISVLSPIGCALLGYRTGDTIPVKTPRREKNLKVVKILHQPESEGNYE